MNIKSIFFGLLILLGLNGLAAQETPASNEDAPFGRERMERNSERRGRIEEARKNFLQKEMGLTETEAERFFPLLKVNEAKMKELAKKGRKEYRNEAATSDLSEAEALKLLEEQMLHETDMLALRKAAQKSYLEVIPAAKLVKLESAKRAFRQELMERMRRRRRQ